MTVFNSKISFWIASVKLVFVQRLVKMCDGRFVGNPIQFGGRALVEVGFNDIQQLNRFNIKLSILEQPFA